jgi:hypothetical protein
MRLIKTLTFSFPMALLVTSIVAQGQDAPVPLIPETLPVAARNSLTLVRTQLLNRVTAVNEKVDAFNASCGSVPATNTALIASCTERYKAISAESTAVDDDKKRFAVQLDSAVGASVPASGALPANSAIEQLRNSGKESTGRLFDGGVAHDDAVVDTKLPNVATPAAAAALNPKLASSKDYRAAATKLTNAQSVADTLNKKMTDLQDQQKASPTPERQIAISNLSAQTSQANGAVAIAKNNLDTVKKKIESGPAIIVDDTPGQEQSTPKPDSK